MTFPRDWQEKELGEVCQIFNGSTPSTHRPEYWGGTILWATPTDISALNGKYISDTKNKITTEGFDSCSTKLVPKGTVLYTSRASIGHIGITTTEMCTNQGFKNFVCNSSLIPEFLYYYLKTQKNEIEKLGSGSTFKEVSMNSIKRVKVPLPPVSVQRKIVAILEKAEGVKQKRKQVEQLTNQLLQSVFIEMFGDQDTNNKHWPIVEIKDISEFVTDGEHITPKRSHKGIYLLSARNIHNHKILLDDVDYIDEDEYLRISKRIVPKVNDVLISCSGSVGRVTRVKPKLKFQLVRSVAIIRPKIEVVDSIFLEYAIETNNLQNQIKRSINQSSQANIFQGQIKKLKIVLPPIKLQHEFCRIVERLESMVQKQLESQDNSEELFDSLMQKAFNGELITM